MARTKSQSDEAVLAAARKVFLRDGHSASTRAVASEVGLSESVLYQRFGTKDALFFRAMVPDDADADALVAGDASDPQAYFTIVGNRLVSLFTELLPLILRVVTHPSLDADRMRDWHDRLPFPTLVCSLAGRIARMRGEGLISDVDPAAAAQGFVASMLSAALLAQLADRSDAGRGQDGVAALVEVAWKGFRPAT